MKYILAMTLCGSLLSALGQSYDFTVSDELKRVAKQVRYPDIYVQARYYGPVVVDIENESLKITGTPVLAKLAEENAKELMKVVPPRIKRIVYVFELTAVVNKVEKVPVSNLFGRLILRAVGAPTHKEVQTPIYDLKDSLTSVFVLTYQDMAYVSVSRPAVLLKTEDAQLASR